jgi:hypothetical protein
MKNVLTMTTWFVVLLAGSIGSTSKPQRQQMYGSEYFKHLGNCRKPPCPSHENFVLYKGE